MIAVGTRVDGYAIEQRLGEGASAEVYLARDDALARHVVIKLSRDARADARLEREAALLSRAGQRGLLQIYGRGEHDGRVYLVLEHASGADLAQLMRDGRLARVDALTVARDIAEALGALHDADILHLDVKPANIVVDNGADGARRARLVDLGAATRADDGDSPGEAGSSAGARQGTPAYLAPERASGDDPSSASDVFSLGVVLHELVCGVRPAHGDAPVLAAATPALSPELCEITARCLAAKPAQRPDARQLANALEAELARTRRAFDCPFVGTAPYDTRAAALYFGREDELDQLAEMVRRPGAVAVVGAAGVGKSSLLHAGLAPRLGSTGAWRVLRLSASAQPLLALARVLSRAEQRDAQHDAQRDEQADAIAARAKLLAEAPAMAALMLDALGGAGSSTLLVVDQLERVLDAEPAAARAFLEALSVAGSGDGDTRVVVAARDVALGPLAELGGATLLERVLPLAELPADDITRAITRAAAVCGARFEPPELADKIARDVTAAGSHEALSLLQLTLRALWARRDERAGTMRQADYVTLGGVHGALALLGEQALSTLDDRQRAEARAVLLALLDERGEAQPRARGELEALGDGRVIDTLLRARVISRPRAAGTEGYDADDDTIVLAHPALSTWPELRAWREADALAHALSRELERAATLWHARGERDEELWDAAALAELARIAPPTSPSAAVERFVAASRRRARRRQTLRRGGAGALLLAVLAGVVGASVIASERAREVPARGAHSASRDGDGGALDSP
ncbi:MAG: serine/threonine protein kinase, partial [Myxococcales bacterium]|nr:serine/threonine protein kinase [Myxococcales bacterium]